jgi:hypothetical protein
VAAALVCFSSILVSPFLQNAEADQSKMRNFGISAAGSVLRYIGLVGKPCLQPDLVHQSLPIGFAGERLQAHIDSGKSPSQLCLDTTSGLRCVQGVPLWPVPGLPQTNNLKMVQEIQVVFSTLRTTLTERVLFYTGRIQAIHEAGWLCLLFRLDEVRVTEKKYSHTTYSIST